MYFILVIYIHCTWGEHGACSVRHGACGGACSGVRTAGTGIEHALDAARAAGRMLQRWVRAHGRRRSTWCAAGHYGAHAAHRWVRAHGRRRSMRQAGARNAARGARWDTAVTGQGRVYGKHGRRVGHGTGLCARGVWCKAWRGGARTRWACIVCGRARTRHQMWRVGLGAQRVWREMGRAYMVSGAGARRWVGGVRLCTRREVQSRGAGQAWTSCAAKGVNFAHAMRSQRRVCNAQFVCAWRGVRGATRRRRGARRARRQYDGRSCIHGVRCGVWHIDRRATGGAQCGVCACAQRQKHAVWGCHVLRVRDGVLRALCSAAYATSRATDEGAVVCARWDVRACAAGKSGSGGEKKTRQGWEKVSLRTKGPATRLPDRIFLLRGGKGDV
ncbi:hypothetical protein GGX14DRAFT_385878 [Mycena pura]|uniref:Uncharacterized protein n=1 Tax=Mycena pura TaxID=153505 RepID=A0AAD6YS58_9AGAR|nr:hypothetical protein GGX14DRAFT_628287 [Mycena pura]KAJ7227124.1 hypothetical protein GGX14DRAFT_385878 [Mycena pura]